MDKTERRQKLHNSGPEQIKTCPYQKLYFRGLISLK